MLLTKQEIDLRIEILKQNLNINHLDYITDNFKTGTAITYQTIHSYLLQCYPGTNQKPLAAAMLLKCIMSCSTDDLTVEQSKTLVAKTLFLFDSIFDTIRVSYTENENGNLLTSAAEILSGYYAGICPLLLDETTMLPLVSDKTFSVGFNSDSDNADSRNTIDFLSNNFVNGTFLSVLITTPPENGTIVDGKYYPNSNYVGTDTFVYKIANENGYSNEATFTVTIVDVPAVTANDNTISVISNAPTVINILANDTFVNIDGDSSNSLISIDIITPPTHGTFDVETLEYTPDTDYIGNDNFEYQVLYNGVRISETATVNITVDEVLINPFEGTTIDLCTESTQGRITYNLNLSTASNIDNVAVTSKKLIIPTATPNQVTSTSAGNLITPSAGNMRTEIANIANSGNLYQLAITYDEDSVSKIGTITCALPHFAITDNLCSNAIVTTFESLTV